MKKLITLAVAVLAGALLFTGCYSEIAPEYNKESIVNFERNKALAAKKVEMKAKTIDCGKLTAQGCFNKTFTELDGYVNEAKEVGLVAKLNLTAGPENCNYGIYVARADGNPKSWTAADVQVINGWHVTSQTVKLEKFLSDARALDNEGAKIFLNVWGGCGTDWVQIKITFVEE